MNFFYPAWRVQQSHFHFNARGLDAAMPNDGPLPNRADNAEYRGQHVIRVASAAIALTTIIVAARFYAKTITRAYFGWDDGLILAGYCSCAALCAVGIGSFSAVTCSSPFMGALLCSYLMLWALSYRQPGRPGLPRQIC